MSRSLDNLDPSFETTRALQSCLPIAALLSMVCCKLTWNGNTVTLPAAHAYSENGRFVLVRLHVRGYVHVRAPNVTIRRSVIEAISIPEAPDSAALSGVDVGRRLVRGNGRSRTRHADLGHALA
ncbi:hypothetical protein [Polyangium sp. 15x6]|uniref:hypothetical protein n=1 Tax=Polyangium sp. 15x6 TaxID=3042687 RepID=UPI00249A54A2|nr:hypothetical protein [Polyangium sp. 15x6]MDI3291258.1 hypothetical protein [Polyangium sp. 15x6]